MITSNARDYTYKYNWTKIFYVIEDAWCTHCSSPPSGIRHAGWFWERMIEKVKISEMMQFNDLNKWLFLVSKDKSQVAAYQRTITYTADEEEGDISVEQPVGRLSAMLEEYNEMKEKESKKK